MDKRTWFVGVGGTLALLAVAGFMCLAPVSAALKHLPLHVGRAGLAEILYMIAWSLAMFVMPGVVTVIAVRRPFLCGLIPPIAILVADFAYVLWRDVHSRHDLVRLLHMIADLSYFRDLHIALFVTSWLISSGVGLRVRRRMHAGALRRARVGDSDGVGVEDVAQ
ncbi:MAG TPA: hypothetical protein VGK19_07075 [Capsulimonadaceae bacterium]|jgi:hypothetical protein